MRKSYWVWCFKGSGHFQILETMQLMIFREVWGLGVVAPLTGMETRIVKVATVIVSLEHFQL